MVLGSGPRPSLKASSSTRLPCSNPARPIVRVDAARLVVSLFCSSLCLVYSCLTVHGRVHTVASSTVTSYAWAGSSSSKPALQSRPSTEKCSLDRSRFTCGSTSNVARNSRATSDFQQPVTILREHDCVPDRTIDRLADKPAEQKIVVNLLHQLSLRAYREERL
jgi:hypothetical protein